MLNSGFQFIKCRRIAQNYSKMLQYSWERSLAAKGLTRHKLKQINANSNGPVNIISSVFIFLGFKAASFSTRTTQFSLLVSTSRERSQYSYVRLSLDSSRQKEYLPSIETYEYKG